MGVGVYNPPPPRVTKKRHHQHMLHGSRAGAPEQGEVFERLTTVGGGGSLPPGPPPPLRPTPPLPPPLPLFELKIFFRAFGTRGFRDRRDHRRRGSGQPPSPHLFRYVPAPELRHVSAQITPPFLIQYQAPSLRAVPFQVEVAGPPSCALRCPLT